VLLLLALYSEPRALYDVEFGPSWLDRLLNICILTEIGVLGTEVPQPWLLDASETPNREQRYIRDVSNILALQTIRLGIDCGMSVAALTQTKIRKGKVRLQPMHLQDPSTSDDH
jgi:hypothetical protein